jgi:hypothetical protein
LVLIQNKPICHYFWTSDSSATIEELAPWNSTFKTAFEKESDYQKRGLFTFSLFSLKGPSINDAFSKGEGGES